MPRGIWILGFGSLLMDMSSELVHSLLPVYLTTVFGASMLTVGLIEGVAEGTAAVLKGLSGTVSDGLRRRKPLVVAGYALSALSKPLFPLATAVGWIFAARWIDRVGKGIRGAPRDALIADLTAPETRGAAYGLRQALDSVGAFLGPLLAVLLMILLANDIAGALWIAVIPALVAVALLGFGIHEPPRAGPTAAAAIPATLWRRGAQLPRHFWLILLVGIVFTLARYSDAFLLLRVSDLGLPLAYVPAVLIVMNVVYALFAYPAGRAADRWPAQRLLYLGLAALLVANIMLAIATTAAVAMAGVCLWGLHMALTQGLLSKLVANAAPPPLRGTAFGFFQLFTGIATLFASLAVGALWHTWGATTAFATGAGITLVAVLATALATGALDQVSRSASSEKQAIKRD